MSWFWIVVLGIVGLNVIFVGSLLLLDWIEEKLYERKQKKDEHGGKG